MAQRKTVKSCRTCRSSTTVEGGAESDGYCRRYPPAALDGKSSTFPPINLDRMICDEWRAKTER